MELELLFVSFGERGVRCWWIWGPRGGDPPFSHKKSASLIFNSDVQSPFMIMPSSQSSHLVAINKSVENNSRAVKIVVGCAQRDLKHSFRRGRKEDSLVRLIIKEPYHRRACGQKYYVAS